MEAVFGCKIWTSNFGVWRFCDIETGQGCRCFRCHVVELAKIPEKPELMLGDSDGRYESLKIGSQKKNRHENWWNFYYLQTNKHVKTTRKRRKSKWSYFQVEFWKKCQEFGIFQQYGCLVSTKLGGDRFFSRSRFGARVEHLGWYEMTSY